MFQNNFLRATIFLLGLLHVACSESKVSPEKLGSWTRTLSELNVSMKDLENKREHAQSYIETAEVRQVIRTQEEKARQLSNLNLYMAEIKFKIDSTQALIDKYEDSVQVSSN